MPEEKVVFFFVINDVDQFTKFLLPFKLYLVIVAVVFVVVAGWCFRLTTI